MRIRIPFAQYLSDNGFSEDEVHLIAEKLSIQFDVDFMNVSDESINSLSLEDDVKQKLRALRDTRKQEAIDRREAAMRSLERRVLGLGSHNPYVVRI